MKNEVNVPFVNRNYRSFLFCVLYFDFFYYIYIYFLLFLFIFFFIILQAVKNEVNVPFVNRNYRSFLFCVLYFDSFLLYIYFFYYIKNFFFIIILQAVKNEVNVPFVNRNYRSFLFWVLYFDFFIIYSFFIIFFKFLFFYYYIAGGEKWSECSVPEEFCGDVVFEHSGHGHQKQTQAGHFPAPHVPPLRVPEAVFSLQLALFPHHVPPAPQKQGPQDGQGSTWWDLQL